MTPTTTADAIQALREGQQRAEALRTLATTAERKQIAVFWCDYFARQITRWEARKN